MSINLESPENGWFGTTMVCRATEEEEKKRRLKGRRRKENSL
jgi:hypothetical protein